MRLLPFCTLLSTALAAATCKTRQTTNTTDVKKILIGGGPTGMVGAADFDGKAFTMVANNTMAGTSASWLLFKEPNLLYAVDEASSTTRLFNYEPDTNDLTLVQNATGSSGVVFLEFNKDKTVMAGAAYGQGTIDFWDVSAADGTMELITQLEAGGTLGPVASRQDGPHPHQILLDPTGQYFITPDLGTDSILVIDSTKFELTSRVTVEAGSGPRHGSFYPRGAAKATHFFLACELASEVKVFALTYTNATLAFQEIQSLSTFGPAFPPANASTATAGELVIDAANRNLYVSNRITGNETDSISHFAITIHQTEPLTFADQISSGGLTPRMFSLSVDESILFSTNQDGDNGLLALSRDATTGRLTEQPIASVTLDVFGPAGSGPQYVMEIGSKGSNS